MSREEKEKCPVQEKENKLEIDYEKLAEAIVHANNRVEKGKTTHHTVRIKVLRFLNGSIYITFAWFCFYGIYRLWFVNAGSIDRITAIITTVFLGLLGIAMFLSQQESLDETRQETTEYFNINVSLIALIVALIALFQSMNN